MTTQVVITVGILWLLIIALFLKWWHGICEAGRKADEQFKKYVDDKTAKRSRQMTAPEDYYRKTRAN